MSERGKVTKLPKLHYTQKYLPKAGIDKFKVGPGLL